MRKHIYAPMLTDSPSTTPTYTGMVDESGFKIPLSPRITGEASFWTDKQNKHTTSHKSQNVPREMQKHAYAPMLKDSPSTTPTYTGTAGDHGIRKWESPATQVSSEEDTFGTPTQRHPWGIRRKMFSPMSTDSAASSTARSDVYDILGMETPPSQGMTKELIFEAPKQKKQPAKGRSRKRPEGLHREVLALLGSDDINKLPWLPTDKSHGYKQSKVQLGKPRTCSWKWMEFSNSARTDNTRLKHWAKAEDEGNDYRFAKYNKKVDIPTFDDATYNQYLQCDGWTKDETDHLFDLCYRFEIRFIIVHDRWDRTLFNERSVEDLKERYYNVYNILAKARALPGQKPKLIHYDADYERRRKEQLRKLYDRPPELMEEIQYLKCELAKIKASRKKEGKQKNVQKLNTAADVTAQKQGRKQKNVQKLSTAADVTAQKQEKKQKNEQKLSTAADVTAQKQEKKQKNVQKLSTAADVTAQKQERKQKNVQKFTTAADVTAQKQEKKQNNVQKLTTAANVTAQEQERKQNNVQKLTTSANGTAQEQERKQNNVQKLTTAAGVTDQEQPSDNVTQKQENEPIPAILNMEENGNSEPLEERPEELRNVGIPGPSTSE